MENESEAPARAPAAVDDEHLAPLAPLAEGQLPAHEPLAAKPSLAKVIKLLVGKPRDFRDESVFKHVSLVAFLAWVGLGADGLSSSCYGPAEAFQHLQGHAYLAVFLAAATLATVLIISLCYSYIIEEFPSG